MADEPIATTTAAEPVATGTDAALAAFRSTAPAAEPTETPVATPSADPNAPAAPVIDGSIDVKDLEALLGDTKDPAAAPDPLEGLKDNPRVQELIAAETTFKGYQEALQGLPYEVANPVELRQQLADAHGLYDVVMGKASASDLLATMLQNPGWNDAQKQKVISDLSETIAKITGKPVAAAAAGVPEDPAMAKVTALEQQLAQQRQEAANAALGKRAEFAKTKVTEKVANFLKTRGPESFSQKLFNDVGQILGSQAMQVIEAAERGDFTLVEKTMKEAWNARVADIKEFSTWLIKQKQTKAAVIPKQAGGGTPAGTPAPQQTFANADERRDAALKAFRGN